MAIGQRELHLVDERPATESDPEFDERYRDSETSGLSHRSFRLDRDRVLDIGDEIQRYPGKRVLLRGRLDGRPVVAKFYLGALRGCWGWYRGLRGIRALIRAGVPGAPLVFAGFLREAGAWLTLVDYIEADRPWPPQGGVGSADSLGDAHGLILAALARHHERGILQNDLNWTNFIPRADCLYSIDGDRVRQQYPPVNRNRSLANLRRLYAYKADFRPEDVRAGYHRYCEYRGWTPAEREFREVLLSMYRERRRTADRFVRRSLAGWKHFRLERCGCWSVIRDRRRISSAAIEALFEATPGHGQASDLEGVREAMGNTFRLRHFDGRSGASPRTAWSRTLLLRRLRIPVEQPAALLETGGLAGTRRGWVVTRLRGQTRLVDALPGLPWLEQQAVLHRIGELLGLLWLVDLHLAEPAPSMFGLDNGEPVLLNPERVQSRPGDRQHEPRGAEPILVRALARDAGHSIEAVHKALQSGMEQVLPQAPNGR